MLHGICVQPIRCLGNRPSHRHVAAQRSAYLTYHQPCGLLQNFHLFLILLDNPDMLSLLPAK